jgi:ubiquinone/menaquinone biosynthesis C-methylase UbiE
MTKPAGQSEIAAAYNDWAETYDVVQNLTRDLAAEALRHVKLNLAGRRVIEVGCGTGRNTEWIAQTGPKNILALDFSEAMLAKARSRVNDPRVRFVQHDIRTPWPIENASADVVIAMLILEHVDNMAPVFAEAARVLATGGQFFLCELHPMRQLSGGQAQFSNAKTGERQLVTAFIHDVSDYVNIGLSSGFELRQMGEWRDAEAPADSQPRILSLVFRLCDG